MPNVEESDINVLVSHYFDSGRSVLDTLAPVVKTLLSVRERRPWFNDNLRENKKIKRKLERKWRASRSHSQFLVHMSLNMTRDPRMTKLQTFCIFRSSRIIFQTISISKFGVTSSQTWT